MENSISSSSFLKATTMLGLCQYLLQFYKCMKLKKSGPDSLGIINDSDFVYDFPSSPNGVGGMLYSFETTK
jgi:hypothetical protein